MLRLPHCPIFFDGWCENEYSEVLREKGSSDLEDIDCKLMMQWRKAWSDSPHSQSQRQNIDEEIDALADVRKIVCFTLGTLGSK
jgi:hypothetical protein